MSKIVLYSQDISPPCRTVLMTAHALGVKLDIHEINLANREHLSEEYVKLNPQHTIPALNDNGFVLSDSHAIVCYLVDKYAKNDSLYPKDVQLRALVNQFLYFDSSVLFASIKNAVKPLVLRELDAIPEDKLNALKDAFVSLNKFLEGKKWLVGNSYTVADISLVTSTLGASVLVNMDQYPNVKTWLKRCEELPGYKECNVPGNNQLHGVIRERLSQSI